MVQDKKNRYEKPLIIFETQITTRAGSPIQPDKSPVDPLDLFEEKG